MGWGVGAGGGRGELVFLAGTVSVWEDEGLEMDGGGDCRTLSVHLTLQNCTLKNGSGGQK